jgi:hypothetical protein
MKGIKMSFKLEINTGNAAFDDDAMGPEIARILSGVAERLAAGDLDGIYAWSSDSPLYDINGNRVGSWRLTNA